MFVVVTLLVVAMSPVYERNTRSAATSLAASTLRHTAGELEGYRANAQAETYPSDLALAAGPPWARRFYRFEYVPLRSGAGGAIDGFLLKARPQRYDCGCTMSLTLATNGKIYMTQENREATANDPTLE
jgi:Tfp pilus assembly protein PilE